MFPRPHTRRNYYTFFLLQSHGAESYNWAGKNTHRQVKEANHRGTPGGGEQRGKEAEGKGEGGEGSTDGTELLAKSCGKNFFHARLECPPKEPGVVTSSWYLLTHEWPWQDLRGSLGEEPLAGEEVKGSAFWEEEERRGEERRGEDREIEHEGVKERLKQRIKDEEEE